MIKKLSHTLAQSIVTCGAEVTHSAAAVAFGLELLLTYIFGTLVLLIISFLCRQPLAWLVFILGFAPLRTTAGGFHANSQSSCFVISSGIFLLSMTLSFLIPWTSVVSIVLCFIAFVLVAILSPVEAENKKLTKAQSIKNRYKSMVISGVNILLSLLFCVMHVESALINLYFTGVAMAAASLIIAKIKKH